MDQSLIAKRVLVVDDNQDAGELVGEIMSNHGHVVAVVNGGLEALAVVADFLPDVIFLDIGMPGMDGYEVAVALRRDARLEQARIVALTAWGDSESRARVAACGFDSHLVKPAALDSLLSEAATTPQRRP